MLWTSEKRAAAQKFIRWVLSPLGIFLVLYGLNIVAWGGMLFLLLCNSVPAMCHPSCDADNSSRRIWIEIDSQILNALFCVTGFGLAPWRIRDFYHWCLWRLLGAISPRHHQKGLNRLATTHKKWFVENLKPSSLRILSSVSSTMLTDPHDATEHGKKQQQHAFKDSRIPTPPWKMDAVVCCNVLSTIFQTCLTVFMWAMDRFNRPSWATGLFVCLACSVSGIAGFITWRGQRHLSRLHHDQSASINCIYEASISDTVSQTHSPAAPSFPFSNSTFRVLHEV